MNIIQWNCRSIGATGRAGEAKILAYTKKAHIICISETWLKTGDNALITELNEKGYSLFHDPRSSRGGGTGIPSKLSLRMTKQTTTNYKSFEVTEALLCQKHSKIRMCSVYRSVNKASLSDFLSEFEHYLRSLMISQGNPLCVVI